MKSQHYIYKNYLHIACEKDNSYFVKLVNCEDLKNYVNEYMKTVEISHIYKSSETFETALHIACHISSTDVTALLLDFDSIEVDKEYIKVDKEYIEKIKLIPSNI